jgi:hypothetical protein
MISCFDIAIEIIKFWLHSPLCTSEEKKTLQKYRLKIEAIVSLKGEWTSIKKFDEYCLNNKDEIENKLIKMKYFSTLKQLMLSHDSNREARLKKIEITSFLEEGMHPFLLEKLVMFVGLDIKIKMEIIDLIEDLNVS